MKLFKIFKHGEFEKYYVAESWYELEKYIKQNYSDTVMSLFHNDLGEVDHLLIIDTSNGEVYIGVEEKNIELCNSFFCEKANQSMIRG